MAGHPVIHAPVDEATAAEAARVLEGSGLSVEEVLGGVLARIAKEKRLPLSPTPETLQALDEIERGDVIRAGTVQEFMAALHADD